MKKIICFLVCSYITITIVNGQNHFIKNSIIRDYDWCRYVEMPFMVDELIDVYIKDTTIVSKHFPSQEKRIGQQDCYVGHWCLYDTGVKMLKDSLLNRRNSSNEHIIEKILSEIGCLPPQKPNIDWGLVFVGCENCERCPFTDFVVGSYPEAKTSLIYMSEPEIKQMIAFENGEQWGYLLDGIRLGDVFSGVTSTDPIRREIDRRIICFLIQKWSPCQIPEVQQLVSVLKEVLPMEYKDEWYEAITGKWRGQFGEKTIEITIDANEFEINGFSKFEGQPDEKRITFYGDEYQQVEGPYVCFTVTEQPTDKEWNGKFYCRLVRNTGKMEGTWTSNNRKLERAFVLERVDK